MEYEVQVVLKEKNLHVKITTLLAGYDLMFTEVHKGGRIWR